MEVDTEERFAALLCVYLRDEVWNGNRTRVSAVTAQCPGLWTIHTGNTPQTDAGQRGGRGPGADHHPSAGAVPDDVLIMGDSDIRADDKN